MFDTLHAQDTRTDAGLSLGLDNEKDLVETERKTPLLHHELGKIQSKLLTAWAFGMSLGNSVEHRARLLKHTLCCAVRFAALLHLIPGSVVHAGKKNSSVSARLLRLIKAVLSFLPWDSTHSDGPCCLGLVVEFSKRLVRLLLTPHPEFYQTGHCQLSSQNLSTTLHILRLISDSLDHTYSLHLKSVWCSAERESLSKPAQLWPSDTYCVPLLQEDKEKTQGLQHKSRPCPQRPPSR